MLDTAEEYQSKLEYIMKFEEGQLSVQIKKEEQEREAEFSLEKEKLKVNSELDKERLKLLSHEKIELVTWYNRLNRETFTFTGISRRGCEE